MGLAEASLEVLVGLRSPGPVTAELIYKGSPVGLGRQQVTDWYTQGAAVAGSVTFGPLKLPVKFDAIRLYHSGEQLADLPRSAMQLDPGDSFTEHIRINGGSVNG